MVPPTPSWGQYLRPPCLEARPPPVRGDHVPRSSFLERLPHRLRSIHPLVDGLVAPAPELSQKEQGVVLGVLHDQHAQRITDRSVGLTSPEIGGPHRDLSPNSSAGTSPTRTA